MSEQRVFQLWGNEPPHSGQWPAWNQRDRLLDPSDPARTMFVACGQRWGKDRLSTWTNLDILIKLWEERTASKSDQIPLVLSWVTAPTSDDYKQVFREYKTHTMGLDRPDRPRIIRQSKGGEQIVLLAVPGQEETTGITIEFKTGWHPDRMVGAGIDTAHSTELAKLPTESWDHLQMRLASPGRPGINICNGPPGEAPHRHYVNLFRQGKAGDESLIFINEPSTANPTLDRLQLDFLESLRANTSERRWRTNQGAELLPAGSMLFRGLAGVCTGTPLPANESHTGHFISFYDPAGRGSDSNVISTFQVDGPHNDCPKQVHVVRWHDDPIDATLQRISNHMKCFPGELHMDETGGREKLGEMVRRVIGNSIYKGVTFTNTLKENMVENARVLIEQNRTVLLDKNSCTEAEIQIGEMQDYERSISSVGNVRFNAPEGGHDDTVTGVIGALWAARKPVCSDVNGVLQDLGALTA